MKRKALILTGLLALTANHVFAQIPWNNTPTGTQTFTDKNVGIGYEITGIPSATTLHVKNLELTSVVGTSDVNLKIERKIGSFGSGQGVHVSGNMIEAIVENTNVTPNTTTKGFVLNKDFKLGIGTSTPSERLSVKDGNMSVTNGDVLISNDNDAAERSIKANTSTGYFRLYGNSTAANGPYIDMFGNGNTYGYGRMNFVHGDLASSAFEFWKYNGTTYMSQMTIKNDGSVGIGDQNPTAKLTVNGDINFTSATTTSRAVRGKTTSWLELSANTGATDGAVLFIHGNNSIYEKGGAMLMSNGSQNDEISFGVKNYTAPSTYLNILAAKKNGKVVIGDVSSTPDGYKLYVQKGIFTERIKVALSGTSNWSDFVFDDDYDLMPLSEVESFIKENHHLPEIPSATEVHKEGLDLAQMDAKLLQKIEELTLHAIEQQKLLNEQQKVLQQQQKEISKLTRSSKN